MKPSHVYAGREFQVEAVLATEDVLPPGSYPATFRIWGPKGLAWEKRTEIVVPAPAAGEDPPLAVPALLEQVTPVGPAGAYQLVANMDGKGAPAGNRLTFHWIELARRIARGSVAIYLDPAVLKKSYQQLGWLPLPKKGFFVDFFDWLYHNCASPRRTRSSPVCRRGASWTGITTER